MMNRHTFFELATTEPLAELAAALATGQWKGMAVAMSLLGLPGGSNRSLPADVSSRVRLLCPHCDPVKVFDHLSGVRILSPELHLWPSIDALSPHVGPPQWEQAWASCE